MRLVLLFIAGAFVGAIGFFGLASSTISLGPVFICAGLAAAVVDASALYRRLHLREGLGQSAHHMRRTLLAGLIAFAIVSGMAFATFLLVGMTLMAP